MSENLFGSNFFCSIFDIVPLFKYNSSTSSSTFSLSLFSLRATPRHFTIFPDRSPLVRSFLFTLEIGGFVGRFPFCLSNFESCTDVVGRSSERVLQLSRGIVVVWISWRVNLQDLRSAVCQCRSAEFPLGL